MSVPGTRLLNTSRTLLKSTSSFSGVLAKFARTAVNKEEGGIKGAWEQLIEPLPQRSWTQTSTMDSKMEHVDPMWLEELHKRQKTTAASSSSRQTEQQSDGNGSVEELQDSKKFEAQPWVQHTLLETDTRAQEMGLFAYPSARNGWRMLPLGSMALLLAAFGVSIELDRLTSVNDVVSIADFHEKSETVVDYVDSVAASKACLTSSISTDVTSLLTCSLLHPNGDSTRSSRVVGAAVLLTTGAIMERLYGPLQFLGAVTLTTGLSNYIGLKLSGTELPLMGTSPAVFFGAGYLGIARPFSLWAVLPNIPLPCMWLMAPITVSLATHGWQLLGSRSENHGEDESISRPYKDLSDRELRRLTSQVAVELSMMESVDESQNATRSVSSTLYSSGVNKNQINASLMSLQECLNDLRDEWSARGGWPSDRYAAFLSDFAAMLLGLGCALATRGRFRGKFPTT